MHRWLLSGCAPLAISHVFSSRKPSGALLKTLLFNLPSFSKATSNFSLATSIPTMHAASFIVLTFLVYRLKKFRPKLPFGFDERELGCKHLSDPQA